MTTQIKTALVTGAGRRVGRQVVLDLARDGWAVAVHYVSSDDEAQSVVDEISAAGGKAVKIEGDLGDVGALQNIIDDAGFARLD